MSKIDRAKNATRNIVFGMFLKLYQILLPFLMRTAMIYFMGVEYLGLNTLFASVLQVLNLAELGVGAAMVFSMYQPIVEDDTDTICALMNLYKKYYRAIGVIIAAVGILITPIIPRIITGDVPDDVNVYVLYLLNLFATVLSYWLFAYKNSILQAHQRVDVISKVTIITNTVQYLVQFVVLFVFRNYYYFVIVILFTQVLTNIVTAICANKLYPSFKPYGSVSEKQINEINGRIRDLFTSKIGSVIYDSADTIVISAFLGLTTLAVYQNYYFIIVSLSGIIAVIFTACTAGIGNSFIVETKEKNYSDFLTFTFIICWIGGVCSSCLLCVFQPFMNLWVGEKLTLEFSAVICFVVYFFIRQINSLLNMYKDASGMWHEDRFRPLVAALVNLILNLILVHFIGIYGVILSTVIAIIFVGMPWLIVNLFTVLFEKKYMKKYILKLLAYSAIVIFTTGFSYCLLNNIHFNLIIEILFKGATSFIISNVAFFILFRNTNEFIQSKYLLNKITKGKFKMLRGK